MKISVNEEEIELQLQSLFAVMKHEELQGKPISGEMNTSDLVAYVYSGYYAARRIEKKPWIEFDDFVAELGTLEGLNAVLRSINP